MDRALPGSLSGWLQFLWSTKLFAGPSSASADRPRLLSLVVLLFLPAMILYPCLDFPLFEPDESRYAQIPREMLERGDFIVPTLQGEPYLDKPPLFYWLVLLSYQLFGYHAYAARLIPALAVHLTILVTYLLGRRSLGERPAFVAAIVLSLAPGFMTMARLLILDGLLTFCVTVALFAALEAVRRETFSWFWWLTAAFATGLGVLTKGPVAILLLVPVVWLFGVLSGQGYRPGRRAWLAYLIVVLTIALPWYIALARQLPGFVGYFFWEHNFKRFLATEMHVRGIWFYAPIVLLALLPGTLLVVPLCRYLLRVDGATPRSPELGFHVLAGVWCLFFFTLSACKLPTYILPALPFLALVIGAFLVHTAWWRSRMVRSLAGSALGVLLFAHWVALPWYARYRSPMSRPAAVIAWCADRSQSVVCYPRNCDSIAFYVGRSDMKPYRSKDIEELRTLVRIQPRTVILCTHRHSLQGLKQLLPPEVRIVEEHRMGLQDIPGVPSWLMKPLAKLMGETALGLSDLAVIEMPTLCAQNDDKVFKYEP